MKIAFDLHNIRDGGGVNYIGNLLRAAVPERHGFERIVLFGGEENLAGFTDRDFIDKVALPGLSGALPARLASAFGRIPARAREAGCDVLYAPGGIAFGQFRPYVTISRNMMPFSPDLWSLYRPFSTGRLRLHLLRHLNTRTFADADGMIFLTQGAKERVQGFMRRPAASTRVIPHGVDHSRFAPSGDRVHPQPDDQVRIVYPSRFEPYKHQLEVLEAVASLRPIFPRLEIAFAGPKNEEYFGRFEQLRARIDPDGEFSTYLGNLPGRELPDLYTRSDILLFASSCENLPNILIEAMSCGIPIISAGAAPMPEVAGEAALYFDPKSPESIAHCLRRAVEDGDGTRTRIQHGLELSRQYSWDRCADETFAFFRAVSAGRPQD